LVAQTSAVVGKVPLRLFSQRLAVLALLIVVIRIVNQLLFKKIIVVLFVD
jgi:hypothetical protein